MKAVHAMITGRVQGVGYRAWTVETASRLGLKGWVRNRLDKSVEALFQGEDDRIAKMQEECWDGPLFARVHDIRFTDTTPDPEMQGFKSRSTL